MYVYIHINTDVCIYICVSICVYIYIHLSISISISIYISIYIYMCVWVVGEPVAIARGWGEARFVPASRRAGTIYRCI